MIRYTLYEGRTSNDNDMVTEFRKKERALSAFKKTKYAYAVVHAYNNEDYTNTLAEKVA